MSQNMLNLAVRFLLELAALYAFGKWGWSQRADFWRYVLMIGLPLLAAALWGVFRVPGDASASGGAPVPVPGWVRLLFEIAFFSSATYCFFAAGLQNAGWVFGVVTLLHYFLSYDRILWLLRS
ncbi:MAG TPA: YrdB family protein [Anaerolineales bacterium]|nr:YrdB family protein [Anaerolineales bacterium]